LILGNSFPGVGRKEKPAPYAYDWQLNLEVHSRHNNTKGVDVQLILDNDFLVLYPVIALLQNPRFSPDRLKIACNGFTWIEAPRFRALALYTDCDLARRYLAACDSPSDIVLAKLHERKALLTVLESAQLEGFRHVIFDAPRQVVSGASRCFCIQALVRSVNGVPG